MSPPKFAVGDKVMALNTAGEVEVRCSEVVARELYRAGSTYTGESPVGFFPAVAKQDFWAYQLQSGPPGWYGEDLLRPIPPAEPATTRARQRDEAAA